MRSIRVSALACIALTCAAGGAPAQPLFESDAVLAATLRGPLQQVYAESHNTEPNEQAGRWTYKDDAGETRELSVKFRQRGNMRREACALPPLRLNFVKGEVAGTLFDGQDKIKLVGVCERGRDYRDFLMLEYLAYRSYALLTDASFDTRLLDLRYLEDSGKSLMRRRAFLIEDEGALARRIGGTPLETARVRPDDLDADAAALLELFEYMIGNTDYSTILGPDGDDCCHNVKLIESASGVVPVPYDFDSSGLVDVPYALPAEKLPIDNVRTRYFNGICKAPVHFERARSRFLEHKDAVINLFRKARGLTSARRSQSVRYLRDFYAVLENPESFASDIVASCLGAGEAD